MVKIFFEILPEWLKLSLSVLPITFQQYATALAIFALASQQVYRCLPILIIATPVFLLIYCLSAIVVLYFSVIAGIGIPALAGAIFIFYGIPILVVIATVGTVFFLKPILKHGGHTLQSFFAESFEEWHPLYRDNLSIVFAMLPFFISISAQVFVPPVGEAIAGSKSQTLDMHEIITSSFSFALLGMYIRIFGKWLQVVRGNSSEALIGEIDIKIFKCVFGAVAGYLIGTVASYFLAMYMGMTTLMDALQETQVAFAIIGVLLFLRLPTHKQE
jgi:hypothetical protein